MEISDWEKRIRMEREQKDIFFSIHPQSPMPPEEREGFGGLDYYPPDPNYRFEIKLHEHPEKMRTKMSYTRGEEQEFLRWGEFRFTMGSQEHVLQAYRSDPEEERLFVPFRDTTSGEETYGAGRYIDLEPQRHRTAKGEWILDFNRAYNPWCAYSERYTCPYVPPENWLKTPIYAGEKMVKKGIERASVE